MSRSCLAILVLSFAAATAGASFAEEPGFRLVRADGVVVSEAVTSAEFNACVEASTDRRAVEAFGAGSEEQQEQIARDMLSPQGWRVSMGLMAATAAMMARAMDCLTARGYPILVGR